MGERSMGVQSGAHSAIGSGAGSEHATSEKVSRSGDKTEIRCSCGSLVPVGALFCNTCGQPTEEMQRKAAEKLDKQATEYEKDFQLWDPRWNAAILGKKERTPKTSEAGSRDDNRSKLSPEEQRLADLSNIEDDVFYAEVGWLYRFRRLEDPVCLFWEKTMPSADEHCWKLFSLSVLYIGLATYMMVDATARLGCNVRIPSFIMGVIFLAAGTSVPDALGSIAVAKQGEGDMAVANCLGSNVFDILLGLGLPWLFSAILNAGEPVKFPGSRAELVGGIWILIIVLLVFVLSLRFFNWTMNRKFGGFLLAAYGIYIFYYVMKWLDSSSEA